MDEIKWMRISSCNGIEVRFVQRDEIGKEFRYCKLDRSTVRDHAQLWVELFECLLVFETSRMLDFFIFVVVVLIIALAIYVFIGPPAEHRLMVGLCAILWGLAVVVAIAGVLLFAFGGLCCVCCITTPISSWYPELANEAIDIAMIGIFLVAVALACIVGMMAIFVGV